MTKNKKNKIDKKIDIEQIKEEIFEITNNKDLVSNKDLLDIMLYWNGLDYFYENFRETISEFTDVESLSNLRNYLIKKYAIKNK